MADTDQTEPRQAVPDKAGKGRRRKRVLIILSVVIGAMVLGAVFLPKPVARYVVARQLDEMGIVHQGVDTLEINLWDQEVTVGPLTFQQSDSVPGKIGQFLLKVNLRNLFSRRAVVDQMVLDGVDLKILRTSNGAISINGIALQDYVMEQAEAAPPTVEDDPWHAGLEKLQLRNSRVFLDQEGAGDLTVAIRQLDMAGFRTWEPEKPGEFDLDATVNGVAFKWLGRARPFADKITLEIDATVNNVEIAKIERFTGPLGLERRGGVLSSRFNHDVSLHADGRIDLATKGKIEIAEIDIGKSGQGNLKSHDAMIDVVAKFTVQPDNEYDAAVSGNVALGKIEAVLPDGKTVAIDRLTLVLPDLIASLKKDGTLSATVKPRLVADDTVIDKPLAVRLKKMTVDLSKVDLKSAPSGLELAVAGKTSVDSTALSVDATEARSAADLTVGSVRLPSSSLTVSMAEGPPRWQTAFSLALDDVIAQVGNGKDADIRLSSFGAEDVRVDQSLAVAAQSIQLRGLTAKLTDRILPPDGDDTTRAQAAGQDKPQESDNAADVKTTIDVAIGRFVLRDGAEIQFTDASVSPEVDFKMAVSELELTKLDTGSPGQQSGLTFQAKINEFTDLGLSGWVSPFGLKPDFDLKLKLKGMELPRFSPYVAKLTGMHMESGQLNLDASALAKQAALNANLVVNLRNLELGELSPEEAKKLAGAAGMPIQTAIGLLQDSDKTIDLKIPVGGTVTEPDIDLSDAIQKAVGGALASIFPPTAIASMLVSASKEGATFAPVPFEEGTANLGTDGEKVAKSLTQLLQKRPKLTLRVCGRATHADVELYKKRLLAEQEIALRRARAADKNSSAAKKPANSAPAKPGKNPPAVAPLSTAEILALAKKPMGKLALDRTRALRAFILSQSESLNGRVAECRSVYDPKDKQPPRANVTF